MPEPGRSKPDAIVTECPSYTYTFRIKNTLPPFSFFYNFFLGSYRENAD